MSDQLVSADPGWTGAQADPTVPHMSAAPEDRPVTLGDLREDPGKAIARIGTILKKDASDPRLWVGLAASYFAPKIFSAAGPIVARAANTVGRVRVDPSVAMEEFSLTKPQKALKAVYVKEQPIADRVPGYDRYMPNASPAPAAAAAAVTSPVAAAPAGTAAPVADTPPAPPATASPVSPALAPAPPSRPASPGQTVDLPMAQRTTGQQSPSWLQNDLGTAARRLGVKLSAAESMAAETLMREHGVSPTEAVRTVGQLQAARTPSGLTLSADEASQFEALKQQGQSGAQAEGAILKLRALAKRLKTPSDATVKDAVARRNQTGRWE